MVPTHDLLALFGALDRSVVAANDSQWTQLVETYLPGTTGPGRQGWYDQVLTLMRRLAPNPAGIPTPSLDGALQNLSQTIQASADSDAPHLAPAHKGHLLYAAAILDCLASRAPAGTEIAALAGNRDVLDDFYGLVGHRPATDQTATDTGTETDARSSRIGAIRNRLTPENFPHNAAWPQVISGILRDEHTAIAPEIASIPPVFAAGSMKISPAAGQSTQAGAAVTEIDGTLCAVLTTDASRADVEIAAVKAIVDPLNWDQLSRFFTRMSKLPCNAKGASQVLEHVSTQPDAFQLVTALKYWKEDLGSAGIINYELSDSRAGTGDNGMLLIDNGYIHIGPNVRDGKVQPGVRIKTSKAVAIEGCSVTATTMLVHLLGWSALGNSMLFESTKRDAGSYARPLVGWQVSPEIPAATTAAAPGVPPQGPPTPSIQAPAGAFAAMFGQMTELWMQALVQTTTSATSLATKWSTNNLTVQDLIDESTKLGGQLASGPWQYLAATERRLGAPPASDGTPANSGGNP